ncbi:MAG: hypothetical protein GC172_10550 [Phycisphaera sp.]|nr:hypothetical protein [Phycisphaera sp.]
MATLQELFFTGPAPWFTVPALVGTGGYLVRLLFGGGDDDGAADAADAADAGAMGDVTATALSVQGLLAFLMGFGWGGLACLRALEWSGPASVGGGVGTGLIFIAMTVLVFRAARGLQSSGNISLSRLVGAEAEVYTAIPAAGKGLGRVRTVVDERERFVSATTAGEAIAARTRVTIEKVNGDNSVLVRAVGAPQGASEQANG